MGSSIVNPSKQNRSVSIVRVFLVHRESSLLHSHFTVQQYLDVRGEVHPGDIWIWNLGTLVVTTWFTPRQPHANRQFPIGEILGDLSSLLTGRGPSPSRSRFPQHHRSPPAACFPTHPHLSVALRRLGASGPGRGRARTSLWGGRPRRAPRRVVTDEAAMRWSRTTGSPAPRLRHPPPHRSGERLPPRALLPPPKRCHPFSPGNGPGPWPCPAI